LAFASLMLAPTALLACKKHQSEEMKQESILRDELKAKYLGEVDASRAVGVSSRWDVNFEDGFGKILYDPKEDFRNHAFRWMGPNSHMRIRRHGDKRMAIKVSGWIHLKMVRTFPVLTVFINGQPIGFTEPITDKTDGHYVLTAQIDDVGLFQGQEWADLNLVLNGAQYHWLDPPLLNIAIVYKFEYDEVP
jgi:hypothetical protein